MDAEEGKADEAIDQVIFKKTFFLLNDLFLYLAIDTVFHPSGIFQNGMEISLKPNNIIIIIFYYSIFHWLKNWIKF